MTLDVAGPEAPELDSGAAGPARRLRGPVLAGVAGAAGLALLYAVDPNQPGHYPLCPFRAMTGLDCPGCGLLRGTHDLLHGDVVGALDHNVLLAVAVPVVLVAWVLWLRRAWTGRPVSRRLPRAMIWGTVLVVVAFWIARDVPGMPFLPSG